MVGLLPSFAWAHFQRVGDYPVDSVPDLAQLRDLATFNLEDRVRELASAEVDVLAYGCTSASYAMGPAFDRELAEQLTAWTSRPAVTAARAVVEALAALGAERVSLASPYEAHVHEAAIEFLELEGLKIVGSARPDRALTNREQGAMGLQDVVALARRADTPASEALLLSCTDMRAVEVVRALEKELEKPVITSNQALVWAALGRLGLAEAHGR